MSVLLQVSVELLNLYRERNFSPAFWAEPWNALTNASFLVAALFAMVLALRLRATTPTTYGLILLSAVVGFGSFCFHTVPNRVTLWLDIVPIAIFQASFLFLATSRMLRLSRSGALMVVLGVMGVSFALLPVHSLFNGSLFYAPSLVAMVWIGVLQTTLTKREPYLILGAACCFLFAVTARSLDWLVPWRIGTHFMWHLLNGVVVYLLLRSWILHIASSPSQREADT